MKCYIFISGQLNGNFTLAKQMSRYTEKTKGMFNSFKFYYDTVNDAKKDLKDAYKALKETNSAEHHKTYDWLNYDASSAHIIKS
jgi:hypothetical protein